MSPTPDSTFNDPQQVIADVQRQLASRTAERDESLAREAAAAEVLQVINASPGDLAPVFEAILEKAHTLCGAVQGAMYVVEGKYRRAVAIRGLDSIAERLRQPQPVADGMPGGQLLRGERYVHIAELADSGHWGR